MKNIKTIMRKELARVFTSKKLIFTTIILPGLLLYIMYSVMGNAIGSMAEVKKSYTIYEVGLTEEMKALLSSSEEPEVIFVSATLEEVESLKLDIENEEKLLLLIMDTENHILTLCFNSGSMDSLTIYSYTSGLIGAAYNKTVINEVDYQISEESLSTGDVGFNIFASMLPMLIIIFLFQGAMAVGPESIAGDKERGTIATLLSTPAKRGEIALGKIFSLSILAVLSSLSSFLGIMLSLPKLMQMDTGLSYDINTYLTVLLIIVSTTILIISMISIVSAFSKTIKEATTLATPLMLISMAVGLVTMFVGLGVKPVWHYAIPLYNSSIVLAEVFSGKIDIAHILIATFSNLIFSGLLTFGLTKMFNSEMMMFTK